ncbi:MAG: neutral/alkaline non-lysosomal ceramidase N-terminal domain-containing protein [Pirellulales bacterium]
MSIHRTFTLVFASAAMLIAVTCSCHAATWKAGAAKVKITPEQSMWMAGYGSRTQPATGFLNDLFAKAIVLEDAQGTRVAMIGLDLVGISPDVAEPVREQLASKYNLAPGNVAICCSHSHSGPVVGFNLRSLHYDQVDDSQKLLIDAYAVRLQQAIIDVVGQAISALAPAHLTFGNGTATFATNRRNNPEADVPRLRSEGKLAGPSDHDVPVLKITDLEGKLTAVLFGYACHATVLSGYDWSSDYPGFAQSDLEAMHPGCTAVFFAGCGADQNPLPRRQVELAKSYGAQLAATVDKVLGETLQPVEGDLTARATHIDLALASVPTREEVERDAQSADKYVAARATWYLSLLDAGQSLPSTYRYPIQVWRLGDMLTLVTLGGEVVVDYALRLKQELGQDTTWVAGYANDVMAYIPSRRVLAEGGYEGGGAMVYYSLPSPWDPAVEEDIVRAVHVLNATPKSR